MHVVFGDGRSGVYSVYYLSSEDNGATWSELEFLSETPSTFGNEIATYESDIHIVWDTDKTGTSEAYYKRSPAFPMLEEGISLVSGWNSLGFPCEPPIGYTTRDLASDIENDSDMFVLAVCNWTGRQLWQDFIYRKGSGGYPLVDGMDGIGNYALCKNQSYFVLVNTAGPDTIWIPNWTNYTSSNCPGWDLRGGWNAMALPFNSTGTGLLETSTDILALDPHIIAVADWNETTQSWMLDEGTGDPFPLRWGTTGTLAADYNWNGTWVLCDQYSEITQIEID